MRKSEVAKLLAYLHSDHDAIVTEEKINSWHDALENADANEIWPIARQLFQSSPYIPKLADLLRIAREREAADADLWGEDWGRVVGAVRMLGRYQLGAALKMLPDSAVAAIGGEAGLRELCNTAETDIPTVRAQFRQRWEAAAKRGEAAKARMAADSRNVLALPTTPRDALPEVVRKEVA